MSVTVEFSTPARADLFQVGAAARVRERVMTANGPREGAERSRSSAICTARE